MVEACEKEVDMARNRDTLYEIIRHLRTVEIDTVKGLTVPEACRKVGITEQHYPRWKREYGGCVLIRPSH